MKPDNDTTQLSDFDSIKANNETILWVGSPQFIPYLFSGFWASLFSIVFAILWILMSNTLASNAERNGLNWSYLQYFGYLPLIQVAYGILHKFLSFSKTRYAYTTDGIMMRTGMFGTHFLAISYDKLADIQVETSILERLFNTGTIRFHSGKINDDEGHLTKLYDDWSALENPYEVFKQIKQVAFEGKKPLTQ